jgi:hypothetical protein
VEYGGGPQSFRARCGPAAGGWGYLGGAQGGGGGGAHPVGCWAARPGGACSCAALHPPAHSARPLRPGGRAALARRPSSGAQAGSWRRPTTAGCASWTCGARAWTTSYRESLTPRSWPRSSCCCSMRVSAAAVCRGPAAAGARARACAAWPCLPGPSRPLRPLVPLATPPPPAADPPPVPPPPPPPPHTRLPACRRAAGAVPVLQLRGLLVPRADRAPHAAAIPQPGGRRQGGQRAAERGEGGRGVHQGGWVLGTGLAGRRGGEGCARVGRWSQVRGDSRQDAELC